MLIIYKFFVKHNRYKDVFIEFEKMKRKGEILKLLQYKLGSAVMERRLR